MKTRPFYDKNTHGLSKIFLVKIFFLFVTKMNGFRSSLTIYGFRYLRGNICDILKCVSSPIASLSKRFSSEGGADDAENNNQIYIPRRIRRRMKEKNLSLEEFEITPVYIDRLKRKSAQETLTDSVVDKRIVPEFPSDVETTNDVLKDIMPDTGHKIFRPHVNPRDTSVLLFPGQGSQIVGMGQKLLPYPGVKELYERASDMLKYDLLSLCLNGPKGELDKTVNCQPALFVTSLAGVERLKEDLPEALERCTTAAGFSLGEITALVYSGAISFEDGLKLIKVRAQAMQKASEVVPSGMMSVFCDHRTKLGQAMLVAKEYCKTELRMEAPVCSVANYLCTEVKVVAGHEEALQFLEQYGREFGLRGTKRLPVSGAFHTHLMREEDAVKKVGSLLRKIDIKEPRSVRVYSNTTGERYSHPEQIRKSLTLQFCKPVRWEQIIHNIYRRIPGTEFPNTYEVGPKTELGTLLKRTNLKAYANYKHIQV